MINYGNLSSRIGKWEKIMSQVLAEKNKKAIEYQEHVFPLLQEICKPLFESLKFTTFTYMRFFENGSYMRVSSNLNWSKFYINHMKELGAAFHETITAPKSSCPGFFLWPTEPSDDFSKIAYKFDVWNGGTIYWRGKEFVDTYGFSAARKNSYVKNIYESYPECLLEFTRLFSSIFKNDLNDPHLPRAYFEIPVDITPRKFDLAQKVDNFLRIFIIFLKKEKGKSF